jgi:hypothetical protein
VERLIGEAIEHYTDEKEWVAWVKRHGHDEDGAFRRLSSDDNQATHITQKFVSRWRQGHFELWGMKPPSTMREIIPLELASFLTFDFYLNTARGRGYDFLSVVVREPEPTRGRGRPSPAKDHALAELRRRHDANESCADAGDESSAIQAYLRTHGEGSRVAKKTIAGWVREFRKSLTVLPPKEK